MSEALRSRRFRAAALMLGVLAGTLHCSSGGRRATADSQVTPSTGAASRDTLPGGLGGTSWRLVQFQGGDETILRPDDPARYTISFAADGGLSAQIDCNRGRGTWKSPEPSRLELGPLALTRARCPPESLHDHLVKQWPYVRSYVIRNGHLFLSLMADGGVYEFEPLSLEGRMQGAVQGSATFRERMALPPGAMLEVTLEDVSKADAPSEVIGRTSVDDPGSPPIAFRIAYEPARIDPARRYAVRARITVEGKPFFTTDRHYPVLTGGAGDGVEVLLRRVQASPEPTESLENTYWKLIGLRDASVPEGSWHPEPHLILNSGAGRVSGSGGCNRLIGSYELSGDRLRLGMMASTMRACPEGMETEQAFLKSLGRVSGWRINGQVLELLDADGDWVARFASRHME